MEALDVAFCTEEMYLCLRRLGVQDDDGSSYVGSLLLLVLLLMPERSAKCLDVDISCLAAVAPEVQFHALKTTKFASICSKCCGCCSAGKSIDPSMRGNDLTFCACFVCPSKDGNNKCDLESALAIFWKHSHEKDARSIALETRCMVDAS